MSYLEELLSEFRKGAKIRCSDWTNSRGYIQGVNGCIMNEHNRVCALSDRDILSDKWEFYQEQEPDMDYIIKNKCLCWFWDDGESETGKTAGKLIEIRKNSSLPFIKGTTDKGYSIGYSHCCPVRRDEVTFYEG